MPSGDQTQDVFRIAAFSGFTGDNWRALKEQAGAAPVLFGDYLAEMVSASSCSLAVSVIVAVSRPLSSAMSITAQASATVWHADLYLLWAMASP